MRTFTPALPIMSAKAATGSGTVLDVSDYDIITLAFDTATSANLTCKVQGSLATDAPTWGSAQSPSNQWDYLQMKDLENGSSIDGDTGFAVTGTDDNRIFEVNVSAMKWLNLIITARSAGSLTVIGRGYSIGS